MVGIAPVSRLRRQRRQYPRPAARALVEAGEIVLLVGRVNAVVVEAEADQQRVDPDEPLEIANDRDRAAGADQERLLTPFLRERGARLRELGQIPIERYRRSGGVAREFGFAIARQARAHEGVECLAYFRRVLFADQPERDFGGGLG